MKFTLHILHTSFHIYITCLCIQIYVKLIKNQKLFFIQNFEQWPNYCPKKDANNSQLYMELNISAYSLKILVN